MSMVLLRRSNVSARFKPFCRPVILSALRRALPLRLRKAMTKWMEITHLPGRTFLTFELLNDLAAAEPENFHRFLWRHHLVYASSYDTSRFGYIEPSRRMLFEDLRRYFERHRVVPEKDIDSVFDAGCSLGYLLRFAETSLFPSATVLRGLDVDEHAVNIGTAYLRSVNSKVDLIASDIANLDEVMGARRYDVVLCCGVLLYLDELTAQRVVKVLLNHTRGVLCLICLAHPAIENNRLLRPHVRAEDGARIHNLDAFVQQAGGRIVIRRWKRPEAPDEYSPPYFLLVEPREGGEQHSHSLRSHRSVGWLSSIAE